jgi:hypothetical protein
VRVVAPQCKNREQVIVNPIALVVALVPADKTV